MERRGQFASSLLPFCFKSSRQPQNCLLPLFRCFIIEKSDFEKSFSLKTNGNRPVSTYTIVLKTDDPKEKYPAALKR